MLFRSPIFGPDKVLDKRNYAPGQHGVNRRKKNSESSTPLAGEAVSSGLKGTISGARLLGFEFCI